MSCLPVCFRAVMVGRPKISKECSSVVAVGKSRKKQCVAEMQVNLIPRQLNRAISEYFHKSSVVFIDRGDFAPCDVFRQLAKPWLRKIKHIALPQAQGRRGLQ
jgi:hypothetical protein